MTPHDFENLLHDRIEKTKAVLSSKSAEYSTSDDKLFNFKAAARIDDTTPEQALWGMFLKHLVSVQDMVKGRKVPTVDMINEKITDSVNYMILLEAILLERIGGSQK